MQSSLHKFKGNLQDMGDRAGHIEDKICEYATSFDTLMDAHAAHSDDLAKSKSS